MRLLWSVYCCRLIVVRCWLFLVCCVMFEVCVACWRYELVVLCCVWFVVCRVGLVVVQLWF